MSSLIRHFTLSAVLYEGRDTVLAQCLELDVRCSAPNRHTIWKSVADHVEINLQMAREVGFTIPRAEASHWKAFRRGSLIYNPRAEQMRLGADTILLHPNVRFIHNFRPQ